MKTKLALVVLLATSTLALAGFKLPSKIFEGSEIDKAKAEAEAKKKPIAILYSDKDSTCPLCNAASETIIRELGAKTVMIYVNNQAALPPSAIAALAAGKFIPKVAVMDAKLETPLGTVTYESIKEDPRKAFREVEKAIRAYGK